MVKPYLNQEKLYKIKNISKKIMSPSRKKVMKKSFIWASNKKQLRVYQGIYFSQRIAKKYS